MNELLKADIFFFITSIAVIVIAVLLVIALIYIIRILRDVKGVSKTAKESADAIGEDIQGARGEIKAYIHLIKKYFSKMFGGGKKKK